MDIIIKALEEEVNSRRCQWLILQTSRLAWRTNLSTTDEIIGKYRTGFSWCCCVCCICWTNKSVIIRTLSLSQRTGKIQNLCQWFVGIVLVFPIDSFAFFFSFSHRANLRINQFFGYFGVVMKKWLSVARNKFRHRIEYAIERDRMDGVLSAPVNAKWTASSIDVASCFTQMVQFWRRLGSFVWYIRSFPNEIELLAWPDILSSIAFLIKIIDDMANATRLYAILSEEKLNAKKFYESTDLTVYTQEVTRHAQWW